MTQPIPLPQGLAASAVVGGGTAAGGVIANHQEPPEHRATMLKVKVAARAGSILLVKPVDAEFDPVRISTRRSPGDRTAKPLALALPPAPLI